MTQPAGDIILNKVWVPNLFYTRTAVTSSRVHNTFAATSIPNLIDYYKYRVRVI